jgi:uncharacterized protein
MKIDAFAHILPPRYTTRLERLAGAGALSSRVRGYEPWIREDPALCDLDARWRVLEPFPDYAQVLTLAVPPVDELGDAPATTELARMANDELAGLVAAHSERFFGFAAALPMGDADAAANELHRSLTELGAFGAQLHTNVAGRPLDDPELEPVLAVADEHQATLWIHPTRSDAWADYPVEPRSRYGIWWSLGWPYETSVCMARLVYSGTLHRFSQVHFLCHHAGAMIPHFAGRLASPIEDPEREAIMAGLTEAPLDPAFLRRHRHVRRRACGEVRRRVLRPRPCALWNRHAAGRAEGGARHDCRCRGTGAGHCRAGQDLRGQCPADVQPIGLPGHRHLGA